MGSHRRLGRMKLAVSVVAAAGVLALAPAAAEAASTVMVSNFTSYKSVYFQAAANVANRVTVSTASSNITITDPADTITENEAECTGNGTNTVSCTDPLFGTAPLGLIANIFYLDAAADTAQNDTFTASGPLGARVSGFAGDDVLTGSPADSGELFDGGDGNDAIDTRGSDGTLSNFAQGDAGDDQLTGGPSRDFLNGGPGKDTLLAGAGDDGLDGGGGDGDLVDGEAGEDSVFGTTGDGAGDVQRGGPGIDTLSYFSATPVAFSLDLTSNTSGLRSGSEIDSSTGFEDAATGRGGDQVLGTAEPNNITTSEGNDTVDGRAGADFITTSDGDDTVSARDGSADRIRCGNGTDSATADQLDETFDCETVARAQVTPVKTDQRAPTCRVRRLESRYRRRAFLRGLRARIDCNERFAAKVTLTGRGVSRAGGVVLVERSLKLGGDRTVRLRPSARVRRALARLRRGFRVTVRVEARDAARNRKVATRRISVR